MELRRSPPKRLSVFARTSPQVDGVHYGLVSHRVNRPPLPAGPSQRPARRYRLGDAQVAVGTTVPGITNGPAAVSGIDDPTMRV
jgi:hypothetical protein